MHRRSTGRLVGAACLAGLLAWCEAAAAGLEPADLAALAEARTLALAGDLPAAQAVWDEFLSTRGGQYHALVMSEGCGPASLDAAMGLARTLQPLWVAGSREGCHQVLWGAFASLAEAQEQAQLLGLRTTRVVAVDPPLLGQEGGRRSEVATRPAQPPAPPETERPPSPPPEGAIAQPPASSESSVAPAEPPPAQGRVAPEPEPPVAEATVLSGGELFDRGNAAYAGGDYEEATRLYEASIAREPSNPRSHNNLGTAWLRRDDPARAEAAFRAAAALDPTYARAVLNLSTALFTQGKTEEARTALLRVIELDPSNLDAYYNLATVYTEERRWEDAALTLERGLAVDPESRTLQAALQQVEAQLGARINPRARPALDAEALPPAGTRPSRGRAAAAPGPASPCREELSTAGRRRLAASLFADARAAYHRAAWAEAEEGFAQALDCEPTSAPTANFLGVARLRAGRLEAAIDAFDLALELRPGMVDAAVNRAFTLVDLGRCDEALAQLRELVTLDPDSSERNLDVGRAAYRCGRVTAATDALEAAAAQDATDTRAARLLDRLRRERVGVP
jgi:tetratricopeptide (TPR) repeat protein